MLYPYDKSPAHAAHSHHRYQCQVRIDSVRISVQINLFHCLIHMTNHASCSHHRYRMPGTAGLQTVTEISPNGFFIAWAFRSERAFMI
jgi:hypothetical protein